MYVSAGFGLQVFERFLLGDTLEECYEAVAEVANRWLDMLDTQVQSHGQFGHMGTTLMSTGWLSCGSWNFQDLSGKTLFTLTLVGPHIMLIPEWCVISLLSFVLYPLNTLTLVKVCLPRLD